MEKQKKVIKKINAKYGAIETLKAAKANPNDEFITGLNDISKELIHYTHYFKGRNIICPCDCDILKNDKVHKIEIFFNDTPEKRFISPTGFIYKIKYLIYYTLVNNTYIPTKIEGNTARDFISKNIVCNFIKAIVDIGEDYGIHSVTASGFNTLTQEGFRFETVDYNKYNLIITNPPFSQYKTFMNTIMPYVEKRKGSNNPLDFILLSSYKNRMNPCVGIGLMQRIFYLGFGRHLNLKFNEINKDNAYTTKIVSVDWITTFSDAQNIIDKTHKSTGIDFNLYKEDYPILNTITMKDNTHPIVIKSKGAIPDNYFGWMQGSIGILTDLNFNEFDWFITNAKKLYNTQKPELNPFLHKATDTMLNFHGIVFKRKETI